MLIEDEAYTFFYHVLLQYATHSSRILHTAYTTTHHHILIFSHFFLYNPGKGFI